MLTSLTVSNFAIIDNISIEFEDKLSVLTGETGAGKSLIIDAIGLLLGERASSSMVRQDADKAIIEGVFCNYNPRINEILEEIGIDNSDDTLIVKREINKNGKSISRINGFVVTLNQLESIAGLLADIHTQLDTKKLFDVRNYVEFVDNEVSNGILNDYLKCREEYFNAYKAYKKILKEIENGQENLDFYKYRLNELKNLQLDVNEIDNLEQELYVLNNYETIYNNICSVKEIFKTNNIVNGLYDLKNIISKLTSVDSKYLAIKDNLENMYYELDDLESTINNEIRSLEFDEERLNYINNRLSLLKDVQRKYKKNIEELIEYQKELQSFVDNFEQSDFLIEEAKKNTITTFEELVKKAQELSIVRKANAKLLKENIMRTLTDLCLDKVQMEIVFNDVDYNSFENSAIFKDNGVDEIDFLVSFNPGESLKPLSKVASGGEMSRVMLAFKTHILENVGLSTIIFDEIDTGISGEVANAVAVKLKAISKKTQVLSITHLPIVASAADQHLFVKKKVVNNRTVTSITKLSKEERIKEIATMISSQKDEITSQLLAESMIDKFCK